MQPVLENTHRDRRQLEDLMTSRRPDMVTLHLAEQVAAPALLRPMLDHLVHPLDRHKAAAVTRMTRLTTRVAPLRSRPLTPRRPRRILARRQRRVTRVPTQPTLQLRHTSLEPPIRLDQLTQPHQQPKRCLPITIKDRLRLSPLHTNKFDTPAEVPSSNQGD